MRKIHNCIVDENGACEKVSLSIKDTLDVVGGKWKLILISLLRDGKMRFGELVKEAEISSRILSKELKELEMHGLVTRTVCNIRPVTVEYALTPYSETLSDVIIAMHKWGKQHRKKFIEESLQLSKELV